MNKNLEKAIYDIQKADALMFAIETAYLNIDVAPGELEKANRAANAFYALWDVIKTAADDLDRLADDQTVVDAIYAVNDVKRNIAL